MRESSTDKSGQVYETKIVGSGKNKQEKKVLTREFLKKYISYAKSLPAPTLDDSSIDYAAHAYSLLRLKAAHFEQSKQS